MIQISKTYFIKGTPRHYLVDCLIAHKKDALLEIAKNHSISVKKSQTKSVIADKLAREMMQHFHERYSQLKKNEQALLKEYAKHAHLEKATQEEFVQLTLLSKGYVYFFIENQETKAIVPIELVEKLSLESTEVSNIEDSTVTKWFLKTKQTVESIYSHCSVSHLTTVWNRHAQVSITNDEAKEMVK